MNTVTDDKLRALVREARNILWSAKNGGHNGRPREVKRILTAICDLVDAPVWHLINTPEAVAAMNRAEVTSPADGRMYRHIVAAEGGTRDAEIVPIAIIDDGTVARVVFLTDDPERGIRAGQIRDVSTFYLL